MYLLSRVGTSYVCVSQRGREAMMRMKSGARPWCAISARFGHAATSDKDQALFVAIDHVEWASPERIRELMELHPGRVQALLDDLREIGHANEAEHLSLQTTSPTSVSCAARQRGPARQCR